ncbi:hypothetical protein AX774_g2928 [Zancudomyces culisetae]|uniref:Uncharacterized protein n=1 Tax=Zancudomyces culisetae TaxID=1213189 RepID=A0A1R1PRG3_ZANCU|nr:hypothetical protein AX774_g2928 [Zancudomyces culisetae]|eukprot:OMH83565.1 hypothetical protein AX774_g2928 [Zancudomyces culisetae]
MDAIAIINVIIPPKIKIGWYGARFPTRIRTNAPYNKLTIPDAGSAENMTDMRGPSSSRVYQYPKYVIIPGVNPDSTRPRISLMSIACPAFLAAAIHIHVIDHAIPINGNQNDGRVLFRIMFANGSINMYVIKNSELTLPC